MSVDSAGNAQPPLSPELFAELGAASHALARLVDGAGPDLARTLLRLVSAIAGEAAASERFAAALADALGPLASAASQRVPAPQPRPEPQPRPDVRGPRSRPDGPFDPYEIYATGGIDDLRARLDGLDIEQLKNIIAQHALDHDRKAMRWRTKDRLVQRIVDNVARRSTHGSAFATA